MKIRTVLLGALLAVLLLVVASVASGCGSTSSDDGVAALDGAASTTPSSEGDETDTGENETEEDPEEAALAWAECMREHGIDVPDPQIDESGRVRVLVRRAAEGIDVDAFEKARDECGTPFGAAGPPRLSAEEREEMQEAMLEFAACMRENGVDMPDPDFSGEGGRMRFGLGGANGIDPESSTFRKAQEACEPILGEALGDRADGPGRRVGGGPSDRPGTDSEDGGS